jgi:HlyD family secretion protein
LREAVSRRRVAIEQWIERKFGDEIATEADLEFGFKPDALALEERPLSAATYATLYAALALLVTAILWSIFGSLDRIVVASGKIATRTPLLVMQPFTTSRIQQINIRPGDEVKKGKILVTFDPAFAQADVAALEMKAESLAAQDERLQAQLAGTVFTAKSGDSSARFSQTQIFRQEQADHIAELKQRNSRLAGLEAQIRVNQQSLPGIRAQHEMAQQVTEIQQRLRSLQAAAELDVMRAQSAEVDSDIKLKTAIGDSSKLAEQRNEALQERNAYIEKWRGDHNQALVKTDQDLTDARESLKKARRMKELASMVTPVDGVVLQVAERSTGSVLREGETLVTLVPKSADLYVEANTSSRDIGYVKVGDPVRVKLEAYPFQLYGTLDGVLSMIGADSLPLKEGDASRLVYKVTVRLIDKPAIIAKRGIHIRPGLVASAEIKTGKRSIASYILQPIIKIADEGMREP